MPVHSRLIPAALLLLTACSPARYNAITVRQVERTGTVPGTGLCRPDQPCELTGTVMIVPRAANRSLATLTQGGTACLPLLLSDKLYTTWRRYDGKQVRVTGTALERGSMSSSDIDQVQYRDRWLSPHICGESALALYVDEIALAKPRQH